MHASGPHLLYLNGLTSLVQKTFIVSDSCPFRFRTQKDILIILRGWIDFEFRTVIRMSQSELTETPSEAVKEKTADLHDLVEETLGQRFFQDDQLSRDGFLDLLRSFYRIYSPLENRMIPVLKSTLTEFAYDPRAIRIRQDFMELEVDEEEIDRWELIPESDLIDFTGTPELLGCLYVVEGAEMGNHVMRSQLDDLLPDDCLQANNFFRYKGEETREHWNDFKKRLDTEITTQHELDRLIESARETFRLFRKGFEWPENS